ncbi:MAG TPA: hypothetical protein VL943_03280, partial [Niabella sp.]|nr:hypothetical protein [Niabella sp.]
MYEITYRFYEEGDFGSLNQVVFESSEKGGGIDFWGLGWLGIDLYDYKNQKQLLNILLEPHQEKEKTQAFLKLQELLKL